jgi:hypothetical protein
MFGFFGFPACAPALRVVLGEPDVLIREGPALACVVYDRYPFEVAVYSAIDQELD